MKKPELDDVDGSLWRSKYQAGSLPARTKLKLLAEREAVLLSRPDGETTQAQLNWIAVERESVVKQIGTE